MSSPEEPEHAAPGEPRGTKATIVSAALQTLKTKGFAGSSAREIAKRGGFNQALIFYHFGNIQNLLLAVLDLVSARRMSAYASRFEDAQTLSDLASLGRAIYTEDLENGYVTVLAEMVAGGISNPELGSEVSARIDPWIEMVERKLEELTTGSMLQAILPARTVAFAVIATYLGVDMLSQLDGDHSRAESLLDLGVRYAPLAGALLPSQRTKGL